ncbi:MAG: isoleucine--tRNA ligase [Rickettsiales bacterium]|nr:isoleucine--tRNA ligase [Rickettsiales bacterium]
MTNFSKTINLPSTNFSMKANLSETEINWIKFWKDKDIYKKLKKASYEEKKYVLHDGPPYANGDLHLGHALNKILKDFICRTKFQNSMDVDYVPGWDCHGLPIEWKIEEKFKKLGKKKNEVNLKEFRNECRNFADHWVNEQKNQFERFGIQTNWQKIYLTMTPDSELSIVEELLKFLESGELYLGFKPVMWSVVEQTALAEAEIEYHEKKSNSIYVKFPVKKLDDKTSIVIWTTTPWTIPCNKAIAFSNDLNYIMLQINDDIERLNLEKNEKLIIAENLLNHFIEKHKIKSSKVISKVNRDFLEEIHCNHPLKDSGYIHNVKLFESSHVTDESGSGFVHIAPNHGLEDFEVGKKNDLGNESTINEKGVYEESIPIFSGLHIFKADEKVIDELQKSKNLISNNEYKHSYPHSWRSKAPLIYRATSQWFISMDKKKLRQKALKEIDKVKWIPGNSKNRILSMIKDRPDWCVSRQRSWGVPITIFISKKQKKPLIDADVNKNIVSLLKENGIDFWFENSSESFLPEKYNPSDFEKVNSILDVWFDSGSSHVYVLKKNGITSKADLYLEGSDQHRGWFQTSLLESCGIYDESPYKSVLTHGFVIDEKGKKMSKSLGNVISPQDIVKKYGADILRIWVASSNYNEDIKISYENLNRHSESYRKIRNTIRFILGNLNGWNEKDRIEYNKLPEIEKYILHKIKKTNSEIETFFNQFNFSRAFQSILSFCANDLSSFFFDIRKDTLYCEDKNSILVRSTKTVMGIVFNCLVRWLSPIIPFTTEEAWQCWRSEIDSSVEESCHLLKKPELPKKWEKSRLESRWKKIFEIRDVFLLSVESKRNLKEIKSSMQVKAKFFFKDVEYLDIAQSLDLSEILIASEVSFVKNIDDKFDNHPGKENIFCKIEVSDGFKCPRCWKVIEKVDKSTELCDRCKSVVGAN